MNAVNRAPIEAHASGKVVLLGEYAVLEGAPALCAATPQRALARFVPEPSGDGLQLRATPSGARGVWPRDAAFAPSLPAELSVLGEAIGLVAGTQSLVDWPSGTLHVDTAAFYREGKKIGLGSSAAVLVAASRVLAAAANKAAPSLPALIETHRRWQGGFGSGVDVATAQLGGVVRFQRPPSVGAGPNAAPQAHRVAGGGSLCVSVIAAGHPSPTATALKQVAALKRERPAVYWAHFEELAHLAQAGCEFWALNAVVPFLPLVERACEVLDALGQAMGLDIVGPAHRELSRLVRTVNGAYKPSGAGGGDVGVAVFADDKARRRLPRALRGTPYAVVAQLP